MERGKSSVKPILLLLLVSTLFATYFIAPGFSLNLASSEPQEEDKCEWWVKGVPGVLVPDEDINRYFGKVVDAKVIGEIARLIDERYPGHPFVIEFKPIDRETAFIPLGDSTWVIRPRKVLLVKAVVFGVTGLEERSSSPIAEQVKSRDSAKQVKPLDGP